MTATIDTTHTGTQLEAVEAIMRRGNWYTLTRLRLLASDHIFATTGERRNISEAGVSARLRDLRKPEHGGHTIERRAVPGERGLYEYRMVPR